MRIPPSPGDAQRAERLRDVISELIEVNRDVPVIVEGKKDAQALRSLGLEGEIITLHRGQNLYEFSEEVIENYGKAVLLLDWDQKGEQLTKSLEESLEGHFEQFSGFREVIRAMCQKDIKDIESIPSLLRRLEGLAGPSAGSSAGPLA